MLKSIKTLLEDKALFIALFITIFIAILSLAKIDPISLEPVSGSDKIYHSIAYFFLMLSWLYAFFKKETFLKKVKYIIFACFVYGIVIEVLQGVTTTYRTASYLDILANGSGVVLAVLAFHFFEKKIRVI
tara:strand:+ start:4248 stop:4637 length:390 start_codon:yes stop_codon:yes gene_type:complete